MPVTQPIRSKIEIFIKSLNRKEWLREALDSVLNQTVQPDRILILDNGSSPEVKAAFEAEISSGKIEWFDAEGKQTQFWNFRRALNHQRSPYLLVMHDDDRLLPDFCEKMVKFMDANPAVCAACPQPYQIDESGNTQGVFKSVRGKDLKNTLYLRNSAETAAFYFDSFIPWPAFVYRKGPAQETLLKEKHGKCTDVIFMVDLAEKGQLAYVKEVLWEHRVHSGQASNSFSLQNRMDMIHYLRSKAWNGSIQNKLYSTWQFGKKRLQWAWNPNGERKI